MSDHGGGAQDFGLDALRAGVLAIPGTLGHNEVQGNPPESPGPAGLEAVGRGAATLIPVMRIALAQINPTVGDIAGNVRLIRHNLRAATDAGADLVVFPELAVIGYPPKDLLLKPSVVRDCVAAVDQLAEECSDTAAIIGYPCPSDGQEGRMLYNAVAFCYRGRIRQRHVKNLLPTYDVFDEHRYFEPGPPAVATLHGIHLGISICEDLWNDQHFFDRQLYPTNPIDDLLERGSELLINCSASPFVLDKHDLRLRLMGHVAGRHRVPLLYCNQVGGNDELVFDGNSCAFDARGQLIAHGASFAEDLLVFELGIGASSAPVACPERGMASAYSAITLGISDYCRKCGFESVVLGLSGGIDSALTGALAVGALGAEKVRGIAMPSRYSSAGSIDDAVQLARNLGIKFDVVPIGPAHEAFEQMLHPLWPGFGPDVTEENMQARIRGVILMAMSNKSGSLLVTTGNKSELAVGYCTLYGDMCGGLAVLSDVPKTLVYRLARWINEDPTSPLRQKFNGPVIPPDSLSKPPSAELRADQTDQDSLPPYEVLDEIVERYVEREQSIGQIAKETGFDGLVLQRMVQLIDRNEYKRKQMPPGLKITGRAFGFGRRMPIAQRYDGTRSSVAAK